jgi:hypothetical protein
VASRKSSRRWLLREIRPAYVLAISAAVVISIFTYFIDWSTVRPGRKVPAKNDNIEQRYSGSIIVPMGGNMCSNFILDNRTGNVRDGGYSKCDEATPQFDEKHPHENMDMLRLREVGKAFRHED